MDSNVTLVLQLLNEKLTKQDEKMDSLIVMMKEFDVNMQVLVKYISSCDDPKDEINVPVRPNIPVQSNIKSSKQDMFNLSNEMSFPDLEESGPQGNEWEGGFGGLSNFNPLHAEPVKSESPIIYTRPQKEPVEEGINAIYVYEQQGDVEIDQDDLNKVLEKIEKEQDKFSFKKTLLNITKGIKTIYSSRDPDMYCENMSIIDTDIEIRYNKSTPSSNNTNYNKLFS